MTITPTLWARLFGAKAEVHRVPLLTEAAKVQIDATQERLSYFLAQCAHETGGFVYKRELWGPTDAQARYERNPRLPWPNSPAQAREPGFAGNKLAYWLGNEKPGDGHLFLGRGDIQTTGRTNYLRTSLGVYGDDRLLAHPELLELPAEAAKAACWFWADRKINQCADANDFVGATHRVNGGENGLPDRQAWLRKILQELRT